MRLQDEILSGDHSFSKCNFRKSHLLPGGRQVTQQTYDHAQALAAAKTNKKLPEKELGYRNSRRNYNGILRSSALEYKTLFHDCKEIRYYCSLC